MCLFRQYPRLSPNGSHVKLMLKQPDRQRRGSVAYARHLDVAPTSRGIEVRRPSSGELLPYYIMILRSQDDSDGEKASLKYVTLQAESEIENIPALAAGTGIASTNARAARHHRPLPEAHLRPPPRPH